MKNVGFAGLGSIGLPMARHLLGKGWNVLVYDIRDEPCTELASQGAEVAASPAAMANRCEHIGVCVRDDDDVEVFLEGEDGLFAGARAGDSSDLILSLHSTISPDTIQSAAERAAKLGIHVLDAPISGGVPGATNGTLTTMVGGDTEAVERARPVLAAGSSDVIHCGALGAGMAAKLCNNMLGYAAFTVGTEALLLARASGLDGDRFREVTTSSGNMTSSVENQNRIRETIEDGAAPSEVTEHMAHAVFLAEKDLRLALELASKLGVDLPNTANVRKLVEHTFGAGRPAPRRSE